ncbi:MAG TPA: phytoene/squalene synthase family protein [Acidobacteriaceae bacterium]|nr:phytoene/squalene synthase family protein [Terriglobia bacterium]HVC90593.1 phytoene/squalene synthase family protein [Acidobacteriaceae bacterium]
MSSSVEQAYAACEAIARREAKNFYYAFRVLPKPKRAAMCAVYAFMRHADDLADDERLPGEERLQAMQLWLEEWHRAAAGGSTDNPVFVALRDTQQRFSISTELLDQLVRGTMMDLTALPEHDGQSATGASVNSQLATYQTFEDMYRYCYFVASVVGLVCIRIFGYSDPRAEQLAEQTGIAFQLTNILRDVREDAERGRIYLPLDDLERHHVTVEELSSIRGNRPLTQDERALMELEASRARQYYTAAESLLPLISADSRAALWVLVTIYSRLLQRIESQQYQVFSSKVKVPTMEKIWILLRGLWMAFRLRSAQAS